MASLHKISPCLWFNHEAEEAARFYCGIFPNSRITAITHYGHAGQEIQETEHLGLLEAREHDRVEPQERCREAESAVQDEVQPEDPGLGRVAAEVLTSETSTTQIVELITAGRSGDIGLAPATANANI